MPHHILGNSTSNWKKKQNNVWRRCRLVNWDRVDVTKLSLLFLFHRSRGISTKNRFYILYLYIYIERLCDGGRQSHVINMEHWANMTGVSTDRRTRSIISLYSIQKKGFVTFSRSQALSTILIILSPSTYVSHCEGDQPMCKSAWRQ